MAVRESFDKELNELTNKLLELGNLAGKALEKSMEALVNKDIDLALEVIEDDVHINHLEEEINDDAIILIARQSPVARDLRKIIVAIKISADVERMADHAVNIAKETIRIGKNRHELSYDGLITLSNYAQEMLSLALKAFIDNDIVLAKKLADMDDQVDALYAQLVKEYMGESTEKNEMQTIATHLSFVARFLERFADHATNISEGIFYLVKGIRYDLNH